MEPHLFQPHFLTTGNHDAEETQNKTTTVTLQHWEWYNLHEELI